MYTIKEENIKETIVKNSRFIAIIKKISNTTEVSQELKNIKKIYPNATHYCYAYIFDDIEKYSDDMEPSGTAGMPLLTILKQQLLNRVLIVVVRYFRPPKLGTSGLYKAYSQSAQNLLNCCQLVQLVEGKHIKLTISYNDYKKLTPYLKHTNIIEQQFLNNVTIELLVANNYDAFFTYLNNNNISYQILEEVTIEKE